MDIKIVDVSRAAKVSPTTVSRVLNNNPLVKADTRKKVLKVIEELNYVPHAAAKNLRQQKTLTLGVIVPDIMVSYYTNLVKGIQNKAYSEKFKVIICDAQNNKDIESEYLQLLTNRSVDGMILVESMLSKQEVMELVERGYVIGTIGRSIVDPKIFNVQTNTAEVAQQAVEHLIEQGHKDIAFISGYAHAVDSFDRLEGYIKALRDHGIPFRPELVENGDFNQEGGYAAIQRLWAKELDFTAVFSANDEMALGVYDACREGSIAIPQELAIVGVDNERVSRYLTPPLSTINQLKVEMGYALAELLIRQINGELDDEHDRIAIIDSQLCIRGSSDYKRT
ncbi:LacI family transcriptional regulator [Paenibacillus profundus]|uniref:LacI family transcriptional regulator n=1 Tax=Paenibacillus profundus TaxID=1173085 RepID=A0ABS8YJA0_9BACL|nr:MULTISPECIES: LacI family DNA-binding transcriptional regulator [Paenibacillus]MCE5171632.1 LacI family transcriptional regulator [Paenibacillus profundus]